MSDAALTDSTDLSRALAHTSKIYEAPTDYTKPQEDYTKPQQTIQRLKQTIQSPQNIQSFENIRHAPKILDIDLRYLTRVATHINLA